VLEKTELSPVGLEPTTHGLKVAPVSQEQPKNAHFHEPTFSGRLKFWQDDFLAFKAAILPSVPEICSDHLLENSIRLHQTICPGYWDLIFCVKKNGERYV
jgi:hypothetical protein